MRQIVSIKYYKLNNEIVILEVNDVMLLIYPKKKKRGGGHNREDHMTVSRAIKLIKMLIF